MMLVHIGQTDIAERVHNAWLKTLEDGMHTYDIFTEQHSKEKVGTKEFAQEVVKRLGQQPQKLKAVEYVSGAPINVPTPRYDAASAPKKDLVGVDVFIDWPHGDRTELPAKMKSLGGDGLELKTVSNRGVKVWPDGFPETFCTDQWCCRYLAAGGGSVTHAQIVTLLDRIAKSGVDFVKTEHLCNFNGQPGYSFAQG